MISAHSLTQRIRRPHRRPSQRRSHHNENLRPPLRGAGRGAFFSGCLPDPDGIEEVVVIPARPHLFWPASPPDGYRGQLEPAFQRRMAAERTVIEREDCTFAQTCILSCGEAVEGEWDFRGREEPYLGAMDMSRSTVLEVGPGNGYFTFHMERQGADVVGLDLGWDCLPDVMPQPGDGGRPNGGSSGTVAFHAHAAMRRRGTVQNGWWYLHRDCGSSARMVYGDVGQFPGDIGVFDVSVFGVVLPTLRDPWGALAQAAACTRRSIIVTDCLVPEVEELSRSAMEHAVLYAPHGEDGENARTVWWAMSPGAVADALRHLGFSRTRTIFHSQRRKVDGAWSEVPMFTVVAERNWVF